MRKIKDTLISKGYTFIKENHTNSFGDMYEVYTKKTIEIRLLNERGKFFVELRTQKIESWFDLALILELIGYPTKDILNEDEATQIIIDKLTKIEELLIEIKQDEIDLLKKKRMKRRFPGLTNK